ncbi:TetR/AcrR family transcriptional regulator [Actinomycetospora endophytica]|uniref:TetR/AcrR family transcriptional regulator n=1 Tax=Actinomycetospora endophytica TaxID=2291215 RepID=A0ABS8P9C3_9PSEU|nr:TetR/AcrR family transcriptional regulator [Actinomycetospora endophytica]MCD2193976.1 TetR/AcrR family transcriptional regulator [Actinomycetospora endophytica]
MPEVKSRRGEYTEATRRALLDAAADLFTERGFARTSLDDVAAVARVTKGAIYHHFSSKPGLFEALFEELERTENGAARAAFEAEEDPTVGALAALDQFLLACSEPVYGALVFREAPLALGWDAWRLCEEKYSYALLSDMLDAMTAAGRIPAHRGEALTSIAFGMLGAAGQLLARTRAEDRERVRGECRAPFVALLAGLAITE